jgi:hypothetical protein
MQNKFAGINPICCVRNPMTQMMTLFKAASAQPSQQRRPTRMVEAIVSKQER